jgi:hypothetical protein
VDGRSVNNQVLCPVLEDATGCKPEPRCYQRVKDVDDEYCPSFSVCPVHCQNDEIECSDGVDARGCTRPNVCIKRGTDTDGDLCPEACPEVCGPGMKRCEGDKKENGCRAPGTCAEAGTECKGIFSSLLKELLVIHPDNTLKNQETP